MTSPNEIKLSDLIAPSYYGVYNDIKGGLHSSYWFKGGRGSLKSSFVAICIVKGIMEDLNANAMAFRKYQVNIRRSVLAQLEWAADMLGVAHLWETRYSPAEMIFKPTGQKIAMTGLDDPKKLKSIKFRRGYVKYRWFEELEEYGGMQELRSVSQSLVRGDAGHSIEFCTYNPPQEPAAWVNKESEREVASRYVHKSTYLDAPAEWLGSEFISIAEELKRNDLEAYLHEYMGEAVGRSDAKIFADKCVVAELENDGTWHGPYMGADWGFSQDPNVLVKCWLVPVGHTFDLYIEYAEFGYKVELDDIADMFDRVPDSRQQIIYADSSRPETVAQVNKFGFRVKSVKKWDGSVNDGIIIIRNFRKIVIHPRCEEMQEEAALYSYKIDRLTLDVGTAIVDRHNHGWDAVRYALSKFIKKPSGGRFAQVRR